VGSSNFIKLQALQNLSKPSSFSKSRVISFVHLLFTDWIGGKSAVSGSAEQRQKKGNGKKSHEIKI